METEKILKKLKPRLQVVKPHPLKRFFTCRGITLKQLADVSNMLATQMTRYLNGLDKIPEKHENFLQSLKGEILKWETENKRNWRSLYE